MKSDTAIQTLETCVETTFVLRNSWAGLLSLLLVVYLSIECGMEYAYIIDAKHAMLYIIVIAGRVELSFLLVA